MGEQLPLSKKILIYMWVLYYIYMMLNGIIISKGSIITLILNGGIFVCCVVYIIKKVHLWDKFGFLYLYLFFLFILILLTSSNFNYSLKLWMKYSIGFLCLPIGFEIFCNKASIKTLWSIFKVFLLLFLLNYLISNMLHLGGAQYGDIAGVEMGNLFDDALHTNLCVLAIMPFMLYINKKNNISLLIVLGAFSIILTIISMKRIPIFCLFIIIICFIIFWRYLKLKYGSLENMGFRIPTKFIISGVLIIGCMFFLFVNVINQQYNARLGRFEAGLENEGRTLELKFIFEDIIFNEELKTFLLGKETFNTIGTYANGRFGKRMIHENYGIILNGTGVLGILIYLIINFYLLILFFRYTKRVEFSKNPVAYFLYITYISYWLMFTAASFSGTIWLMLYPSVHYLVSGMILRYYYEYGNLDYVERKN